VLSALARTRTSLRIWTAGITIVLIVLSLSGYLRLLPDIASTETLEIDCDYKASSSKEDYCINPKSSQTIGGRAPKGARNSKLKWLQRTMSSSLGKTMAIPQNTGGGMSADHANGYSFSSGYYYNPYYGYPVPYYPCINYGSRSFPSSRSIGLLPRGNFVSDVKQRAP
jgi:hypothetical protein